MHAEKNVSYLSILLIKKSNRHQQTKEKRRHGATGTQYSSAILFSGAYLVVGLIALLFTPIFSDTLYYWDWGRHLALGYYDDPPLIAYWLRLQTSLLGHSAYALQSLGLISTLLTGWIVYLTAYRLFNPRIAIKALALFELSNYVFTRLVLRTTYDNPQILLWTWATYLWCRYLQTKKIRYLYWTALASGLLLLAKYIGILWIISLLLFIGLTPKTRRLFTNPHFYGSALLVVLLFSPVIFWNATHTWASFAYQLAHGTGNNSAWFYGTGIYLRDLLLNSHLVLLLISYGILHDRKVLKCNADLRWLSIVTFFPLLFFLFTSIRNPVDSNWIIAYFSSAAILGAYYFEQWQLKKTYYGLLLIYIILIIHAIIQLPSDPRIMTARAANDYYVPEKDHWIIADDYKTARFLAFYLQGQPAIYTLCGKDQNQYQYWQTPLLTALQTPSIHSVIYFNSIGPNACLSHYLTHCQTLGIITPPPIQHRYQPKNYRLTAYRCQMKLD